MVAGRLFFLLVSLVFALLEVLVGVEALADDWKKLGDLPARVTIFRDGKIQTVDTKRSELGQYCKKCIHYDHRTFDFLSTENREIVNECSAATPEGSRVRSEYENKELCKKSSSQENHDAFLSSDVAYDVTKNKAGGLAIKMTVRYMIPQSVSIERAHEMLAKSQQCIPDIKAVWSRYGINFDLRMDSNFEAIFSRVDHTVLLKDDVGQPNTGLFYFFPLVYDSEPRRQELYCRALLHEFGHYLGLDDEYPDQTCKDRPDVFISEKHPSFWPRNVMSDALYEPWDQIDFYPHQIKKVLSPLCR